MSEERRGVQCHLISGRQVMSADPSIASGPDLSTAPARIGDNISAANGIAGRRLSSSGSPVQRRTGAPA